MLPDAFTPPSGGRGAAAQAVAAAGAAAGAGQLGELDWGWEEPGYEAFEEDQLFTTPVQMLRAVDLYAARLERGAAPESLLPALPPGSGDGSVEHLLRVLAELREDTLSVWEGASGGQDDF